MSLIFLKFNLYYRLSFMINIKLYLNTLLLNKHDPSNRPGKLHLEK